MAKTDTKALLRVRFTELRAERDKVEASILPLNAEIEAIRAESSAAEAKVAEKRRPLREHLSEIDAELSALNAGLTKRLHNGARVGSTKG